MPKGSYVRSYKQEEYFFYIFMHINEEQGEYVNSTCKETLRANIVSISLKAALKVQKSTV